MTAFTNWLVLLFCCAYILKEQKVLAQDSDSINFGDQTHNRQADLSANQEGLEYDEYGNVIVRERVYSEKELAAMQAVYPQDLVFTTDDIKNGASVIYLIGRSYLAFHLL